MRVGTACLSCDEIGLQPLSELRQQLSKQKGHVTPQESHAQSSSNQGTQSAISYQYSRQILPKCLPAA